MTTFPSPSPSQPHDAALTQGAQALARTIAAHGGEAFLALQTLQAKGTGTFTTPPQMGGLTIPLSALTLSLAPDGCSRLEALSLGGRVVVVNRGQNQGGFALLARRTLPLPANHLDGIEPLALLRTAFQNQAPVAAVACERDCFDIYREHTAQTRVFVDPITALVSRTVTKTPRGEMTVLLSDYQIFEGVAVFGEVAVLEESAPIFTLQLQEIRLNLPLAESLFQKP